MRADAPTSLSRPCLLNPVRSCFYVSIQTLRSSSCAKLLKTLLAQIRKKDPERLRIVLRRNTTFAFPQGHFLAAGSTRAAVWFVLIMYIQVLLQQDLHQSFCFCSLTHCL